MPSFIHHAATIRRTAPVQETLRVLKGGLENDPTSASGFALLAVVLTEEGRHAQALGCWERCLALQPDNEEAQRGAAAARLRLAPAAPAPAAAAAAPAAPAPAGSAAPAGHGQPQPRTEHPRFVPDAYDFSSTSGTPRAQSDTPDPGARGAIDRGTVALADLLIGLIEYRDPVLRGGSSLTRLLAGAIGRQLGLAPAVVQEIELGAVLRDLAQFPLRAIISDLRLQPGANAERQVDRHTLTALALLDGIELPNSVRRTIAHHHEHWDGTGYPEGLTGDAIPLGARIVAVADALVAMVAPRPHRLAQRVPAALDDIRAGAGTRYDPAMVGALLRVVLTSDWRGLGFGLRDPVLVVDPDETRAAVTSTRLCSHGYYADAAFSAEQALERMGRSRVAGLIVSAALPRGELARLLGEVRETASIGMTPAIVTEADGPDRLPLLKLGADVCLPPHCEFEEVRFTLDALLRKEAWIGSAVAVLEEDVEPSG